MKPQSLFACLHGTPCLLSNGEKGQGLCDLTQEDNVPLPPAIEIFSSDVVKSKPFVTEPVNLQGGLVLLKGRVHSTEVFGVSNTDLVPGKYEGGLKLWECAIDLVNTLRGEIKDGRLSLRGKRVLELGCGHGLPGIYACLKGASTVHFQDFNVEVLRSLTISNVHANLEMARSQPNRPSDFGQIPTRSKELSPDVHYYAGDWEDMDTLLSVVGQEQPGLADEGDCREAEGSFSLHEVDLSKDSISQYSLVKEGNCMLNRESVKYSRKLPGTRACERGSDDSVLDGGYDIILMSETVYSIASLPKLYALIKKCLRPPYGVVYLAAKKHYFGVGGGTRALKSIVDEDGYLGAHLVTEFADGFSNIREIWKFFFR